HLHRRAARVPLALTETGSTGREPDGYGCKRATKVCVPPHARFRLGRAPACGRVSALETAPDRRRPRRHPAPLARPAERSVEGSAAPGRGAGADWNRVAAAAPV